MKCNCHGRKTSRSNCRRRQHITFESQTYLERWRFVVGGEPGLALAFFFGDEFGAFAAFGVDAVAAVVVAGLFAFEASSQAAVGI